MFTSIHRFFGVQGVQCRGRLSLIAAVAVVATLAGCSSKPPDCADSETVATVRGMLVDDSSKELVDQIGPTAMKQSDYPKQYFDGLKMEITNIVSGGYQADAKKHTCRGKLKVTTVSGQTAERQISYSTQKTVGGDQKASFLLEIQDFQNFIQFTVVHAKDYFFEKRFSGYWAGTYTCSGQKGTTDGPFSAPATMEVNGRLAKLERTPRSGTGEHNGWINAVNDEFELFISGSAQESPVHDSMFTGKFQGNKIKAYGKVTSYGQLIRSCQLDLTREDAGLLRTESSMSLLYTAQKEKAAAAATTTAAPAPVVAAVAPVVAVKPSFNCAKAASAQELLICGDPALASADAQIGSLYKEALSQSKDKAALTKGQVSWRKNQRDTCSTAACIEKAHLTRIEELRSLLAK